MNTPQHPIEYNNNLYKEISTSIIPSDFMKNPHVNILDIGCGYGGLLFSMSEYLEKTNDLGYGMEIRDKVTNYAGERLYTLRLNSGNTKYNNISFVRTNTMKLLLNYFYKGQIDKMFFCFADPHFKKNNHKKRIINKYLLNDYSYLLKIGGILYSITDVKDLHIWHRTILNQNPCFSEISIDELEKDPFLQFMKNTDEARKVIRNKGNMYYTAYRRVEPKINSLDQLYDILSEDES